MNNEQRVSNKYQIAAVILAAGVSSRMCGVKKEYQELSDEGLTVLGCAVSAFKAYAGIIVIAIPENGEAAARQALPLELFNDNSLKIIFVNGGSTRCASVFNALSALVPYEPCYVIIHDGARPWVKPSLIENIIGMANKYDAVIPAVQLTDTPKLIENSNLKFGEHSIGFVKTHLKRNGVCSAQTPQIFRFPDILRAHEKAAAANDEEFTDDAEIWGRFIGEVAVISGDPGNKKITFPEDLINN